MSRLRQQSVQIADFRANPARHGWNGQPHPLTGGRNWSWLRDAVSLGHGDELSLKSLLLVHILYENAQNTFSFRLCLLTPSRGRGSFHGPRWDSVPRPRYRLALCTCQVTLWQILKPESAHACLGFYLTINIVIVLWHLHRAPVAWTVSVYNNSNTTHRYEIGLILSLIHI